MVSHRVSLSLIPAGREPSRDSPSWQSAEDGSRIDADMTSSADPLDRDEGPGRAERSDPMGGAKGAEERSIPDF